MQTGEEKNWEQFIDKVMGESGPESPGKAFTDKVLMSLESLKAGKSATSYDPPISGTTWTVIALITAGILAWSAISGASLDWNWMPAFDLFAGYGDVLQGVELPVLSNTTVYSIGALALFICVQLLLFKRQIDKRLALN